MKNAVLPMLRSLALLLVSLALVSCAHTTVPSLNPEGAQPQLPGKFVWYDLFTTDLAAVEVFYHDLFGWEFAAPGFIGGKVKTIKLNGAAIANAVEINLAVDKPRESRWLGYMSVVDVNQTARSVKAAGGTIHTPPKELPDRGRIAVCLDSQGAVFAILQSTTGDPSDADLIRHQLVGSELWTHDLDAALTFYHTVNGYTELPVALKNGGTYSLLAVDGRPRAGLTKILWDDVKPNWIPYVVVEDVADIVEKAEKLGGRLLLGQRIKGSRDAVAILSDPAGGIFGVQRIWKPGEVQP